MADDTKYPEDYQSPDEPKPDNKDNKNGNPQEQKEEEKEIRENDKSSPKRNAKGQSLELDETEKAALRWLNEEHAMQPLLDESPTVRKHKAALYNLALRC